MRSQGNNDMSISELLAGFLIIGIILAVVIYVWCGLKWEDYKMVYLPTDQYRMVQEPDSSFTIEQLYTDWNELGEFRDWRKVRQGITSRSEADQSIEMYRSSHRRVVG